MPETGAQGNNKTTAAASPKRRSRCQKPNFSAYDRPRTERTPKSTKIRTINAMK
jgi:hypothetical protein